MYIMLPLTTAHYDALADLLHRRNQREKQTSTTITDGTPLLRLAAGPHPRTQPIGMWEDNQLLAAFALVQGPSATGWTRDERAEPAWTVHQAFADPAHNRLGRLATLWITDHAARHPDPPRWIRCTAPHPRLAWYLERHCGWTPVRTTPGRHHTLLQKPPQHIEHFSQLVTTGIQLTAKQPPT
ncbi:hypothetical protein ACWF95_36190 [Streptomyces vinaceus]